MGGEAPIYAPDSGKTGGTAGHKANGGINMFGADSTLYIKTKLSNHMTIVEDSYFTAPFKIAKPFYDYGRKLANIVIMTASAGIMEGDRYSINVEAGEGSAVSLQGQSFSKIHSMKNGFALQHNNFSVEENAFFDYNPKPTIPFAGSNFVSETVCRLKKGARYLYSEILACGREKSGESFLFKQYRNCSRVYYDGRLIFLDNQLMRPETQELSGIGFFEGFTHQATLAYFHDGMDVKAIAGRIYDILEGFSDIEAGVSAAYKYGISVRILAHGSDCLENILKVIRADISGCEAVK